MKNDACPSLCLALSATPEVSVCVSRKKKKISTQPKRVKGKTGKCQESDFPHTPGNRKKASDFFLTGFFCDRKVVFQRVPLVN